jgi:glycosyltransferase involved in cell wall biosynthesis
MNILLINHYAGSAKHGMEYRPYYLAREWIRQGHQVTIVGASWTHTRMRAPEVNGNVTEEEIDGIRYIWLKTPAYHGNGVARVLNIMAFVGQLLRYGGTRVIGAYKPEVVIASSTYPLDMVPAYHLARRYHAKLIYEIHDLWPLSLIEVGGMSPRHPFIMLLQWAEDFGYRRADRVVSLLPKAGSYMRAHGMADHKFAYIPNGIDVAEWQGEAAPLPEEHRVALRRLKEEKRFLVGYAGAHGLANGLHILIEAAQRLQTEPVTFVLVGHGPEKEGLCQQARQRGLTNLLFLPSVPKPAIPAFLAAMDVLFISLQKTPLFRFGVSPNKLMDYMMAGKPVIQAIEAGNDLVRESGCGISVRPEDSEAVVAAVLQLMSCKPAEREAMGHRGKQYVLAYHDYRILVQQFLGILPQAERPGDRRKRLMARNAAQ